MKMQKNLSPSSLGATLKRLRILLHCPSRRFATLGVGLACLAAVSVSAQTYTWDPAQNHTGSDGSGTWDVSTPIWASGGSDVAWPNSATVATIGSGQGAAGTIVFGATVITNNGITFNSPASGNYTLSGGTNYLAGATPTITVNGSNVTIASSLQGASGLVKAGGGALVLTGSNVYTGATVVTNGALQLTSNSFPSVLPVLYMAMRANGTGAGSIITNQGTGGAAMNAVLNGTATISQGAGVFGHDALAIGGGAANAGSARIASAVVPLSRSATWTVAMWVKTTQAGGCYAYQGSGGWVAGNVTYYFGNGAQAGTAGGHQGAVCNSSGWDEGTSTVGIDGNWHFLTMVNNAGTFTFYLDGVLDATATGFSGTGEGVGTQFWLGGSGDTGDGDVGLNGLISDVYIYNVALNAAQVSTIKNAASGPAIGVPVFPNGNSMSIASGANVDLYGHPIAVTDLSGNGLLTSSLSGATVSLTNPASSFNGSITGGVGVTWAGSFLNLSGTNAYFGVTTVSNGIVNITGSETSSNLTSGILSIGANPASPAVVNFSGTFFTNNQLQLGVVANSLGALYQKSGIMNFIAAPSGNDFQIGNAVGAYGYYYLGAGATVYMNEIGVPGEANSLAGFTSGAGNGLMDVYGTVQDNGWLTMARSGNGNPQTGVLNVYPGATLLYNNTNGGGLVMNWGSPQTCVVNILGGSVLNNGTALNSPVNLMNSGNVTNLGVVNLNSGGVLQAGFIQASSASGTSIFNFNGGTLLANENQGTMFATALTAVKVYSAGGTINNNGFSIACGHDFTPPTGNGVYGYTLANAGAGYLTPPIVLVTNGTGDTTGVGATAVAQIDTSTGGPTSGQVTNVIITSPGYNYTLAPGFSLIGGSPTTPAVITGVAPTPNSAGGSMTFSGTGSTTMNGAQTYGGTMNVTQGALIVNSGPASTTPIIASSGATVGIFNGAASSLSLSPITINSGAALNLVTTANNFLSNTIALSTGTSFTVSALGPNGIAVPVTIGDGVTFSVYGGPGGSWTVPGTLTLGTTSGTTVNLSASSGATSTLVVGTLALHGTITVNLAGNISVGGNFPFLTYTNLTGSGTFNFVLPSGVSASIITNVVGGVTTLSVGSVTSASSTTWAGLVNGTWDLTTANWLGGSLFAQGQPVLFDDAHNTGSQYLITNVSGTFIPSSVTVNNSLNNYIFSNNIVIAGPNGLTKSGTANLTLYTHDTYIGPTIINGGQIVVGTSTSAGVSGPLGLNSAVSLANTAGAALNVNGIATTIGSLSGGGAAGGNVILGSGTLSMGGDGTSQTFAGIISGSGNIAQIGGTETLAATNTFTGAISGIASNSTLVIAGMLNNGSYAGTISDSGVLVYNSPANQTNTGVMSGAGNLQVLGTGSLKLTAANTFTGQILVNGGTLIDTNNENSGNPTASGFGNPQVAGRVVTVTNGGTVTLTSSGGNEFGNGGTIPLLAFNLGPGGLVQIFHGNAQMGPVILNGGAMVAAGASSTQYEPFCLSSVTSGGTVPSVMTSLNSASQSEGYNLGINLASGAQITFNVAPTGSSGPDLNISAQLGNTGNIAFSTAYGNGFILTGGGTMALTAPNFFTGNITISNGTLMLADNAGFTLPNQGGINLPTSSGSIGSASSSTYAGNIINYSNFVEASSTAETLSGAISGTGSIVVGVTNGTSIPAASLTITGAANTYTGQTVVGGGTLFLTGAGTIASSSAIVLTNGGVLDITGLTSGVMTMGSSQNLIGGTGGVINGPTNIVVTGNGTAIFPGGDGTVGTLSFPGGLTMSPGASMNFDLSTSHSGANDQVTITGSLPLVLNYNSLHIKAPSTAVSLDSTADYVLVTATGGATITGSFLSAPFFDVAPANANHYTIVTTSTSVVLHYNQAALPQFSASSTTPSGNLVRNQTVLLSVTAVPGSNPITNVFLNLAPLGGSSYVQMTATGTPNVYTNVVTIPPGTLPGVVALVVEAQDSQGITGVGFATLPIVATVETWIGGGTAGQENFDANPDWLSGLAPGYVGDSLVFASNLSAGLNVNLDNNYTANYLRFSNNAPAFVIGTSDASTLTLRGGLTNTSSAAQTLNVPVVASAPLTLSATAPGTTLLNNGLTINGYAITNTGSGTNTIAGINDLSGGGSLTQAGTGMLSLTGVSTYTGATTVAAGTLGLTGVSGNAAASLIVGSSSNSALLLVGNGADVTNYFMDVGNLSNAVGAVYQTGGLITILRTGVEPLDIGNVQGSYGYYNAAGGTNTTPGIAIAGEGPNFSFGASGSGVLEVTGGTVNNTGWIVMSRGSGVQSSVLNMYGGSLTYGGGGLVCDWNATSAQTAVVNVMGGVLSANIVEPLNMNTSGNAASLGALNLIGGSCQPAYVTGGGQINFNGGTLAIALPQTVASFIAGPNPVVFANGGTLNNNGQYLTNANAIVNATGNGVSAPTITNAGAGYVAPPFVLITNATGDTTGFGATAIAQINPTTHTVTNVLITCPGQNYTAIPLFVFSGGGATIPAGARGNALTPNSSGVMTFDGTNGETFLAGACLFTNLTVVTNGYLGLLPGGSIASGTVFVAANAYFDVLTGYPNGYVWPANQNLSGGGYFNGTITLSAGDELAPPPSQLLAVGNLAFNPSLTMGIGSTAAFRVNHDDANSGVNDRVTVFGTLTLNGNSIHVAAPSAGATLDAGDYTLFVTTGGASGPVSSIPIWDVAPANSNFYNVQVSGNNVVLHYSQYARPTGSATANPNPVLAGQTVTFTVNATNGGGGAVSQVTIDTTALGGGLTSLSQTSSSGGTTVWTGHYPLSLLATPGVFTLPVVLSDSQNSISIPVYLTIGTANFTWNGGHSGVDQNWDDNANWVGGLFPPYFGNDITFAGTVGLTPVMDAAYSLGGMAFAPGAGLFNLTNNSSGYSLTLQAGMTVTNNSGNVQTFNLPVILGGSVTFNAASNNMVLTQPISEQTVGTGILVSKGRTNIMTGPNPYAGSFSVSSGAFELADSSLLDSGTYAGNIAVSSAGTFIINSTNNMIFAGPITGSGGVQVNGVNTTNTVVTFSGTNSYQGPLLVNGATVIDVNTEANGAPPGTGLGYSASARTVTITNGGVVSLNTQGGNFAGYGTVTPALIFNVGPGCLLVTSNGNDQMGPIILNGGTLLSTTTTGVQYDSFELSAITSGGTSPSLMSSLNPGDPTGGACLTINAAAGAQLPFTVAPTGSGGADLTVNIILVNSGGSQNATGFVLNGGGVLALNDSNIFTGPVTLSNGVARLNAAEIAGTSGPLGNGGTISNFGGTLQFSVTNQFDYSSRFSTAAGQTYKIDTAGQSVTFATALSSSGAGLTKLGAGALNLTAPNTYTGATTVSNGTLVVASTGSIGSTSAISVSGGGTLDVSSQSVFTVPGGVTLTGSGGASPAVIRAQALNVNGPITLNYSAGQSALNVVGTLTLSHNAFTVNAASQLGAGTYTLISQQSGNIVSTGPYTVTGTAVGAIGTTASIVVNGGAVQLVIVSVPANITFTYNSSLTSLSISWPPAFLGSTLLYQSNSTSVGLLTAPGSWLVYPGSTNVTNITIPIARTNEAFFELRHP